MALIRGHVGRRRSYMAYDHESFILEPLDDLMSDLLHYNDFLIEPQADPFHHRTRPLSAGPRIESKETPEAYLFQAELPGYKKEELQVQVEDGKLLKISGEKKAEREEKHDNWWRVESSRGKFMSAFTLPENCRADHAKSSMTDGVLTITVPKRDHGNHSHVRKTIDVK